MPSEAFEKARERAVKIEKKKLSPEEAKELSSSLFPSREPIEDYFEWDGNLWPFKYVRPSFGVEAEATKRGFKIGKNGELEIDHKEYAITILLKCLRDAPFKIDRKTIEDLDPAIINQVSAKITEGFALPLRLSQS